MYRIDVLGGDVQYNFDFRKIEFVSGFDFFHIDLTQIEIF